MSLVQVHACTVSCFIGFIRRLTEEKVKVKNKIKDTWGNIQNSGGINTTSLDPADLT